MNLIETLRPFKNIILIWLVSHALVFSLGFAVTWLNEGAAPPLSIVMRQFYRWDSGEYIDIAKNWYIDVGERSFYIVFFPLYPVLIRLTTFDFQYINLSALLISNLSALIASIYLFRLARLDFGEDVAEMAVLYLSIFPTAYFLSAIYTEALFIALAIISVYYARNERWLIAGVSGLLAASTRSFGLILFPTLLFEYLLQRKWRVERVDKEILWSGLVIAGFTIYLFINYQVTGDFFNFIEVQGTHWQQTLDPLLGLERALWWTASTPFPDNITVGSAQIIFAVLGLLGVVGSALLRLRLPYTIYALFSWMLSVSTGWWISVPRYVLTMFPLFFVFGLLGRRKRFNYLAIGILSVALFSFTILFCLGRWAF